IVGVEDDGEPVCGDGAGLEASKTIGGAGVGEDGTESRSIPPAGALPVGRDAAADDAAIPGDRGRGSGAGRRVESRNGKRRDAVQSRPHGGQAADGSGGDLTIGRDRVDIHRNPLKEGNTLGPRRAGHAGERAERRKSFHGPTSSSLVDSIRYILVRRADG